MEPEIKIQMICGAQAASELKALNLLGPSGQFAERENLAGEATTWIAIATLAFNSLPRILDFIEKWRHVEEVKRVKIGNIEIVNPSEEDMKALRSRLKGKI
jgi:hypothetical protein